MKGTELNPSGSTSTWRTGFILTYKYVRAKNSSLLVLLVAGEHGGLPDIAKTELILPGSTST